MIEVEVWLACKFWEEDVGLGGIGLGGITFPVETELFDFVTGMFGLGGIGLGGMTFPVETELFDFVTGVFGFGEIVILYSCSDVIFNWYGSCNMIWGAYADLSFG